MTKSEIITELKQCKGNRTALEAAMRVIESSGCTSCKYGFLSPHETPCAECVRGRMRSVDELRGIRHCNSNGFHCEVNARKNGTYVLDVTVRSDGTKSRAIFKTNSDLVALYKALHICIFE